MSHLFSKIIPMFKELPSEEMRELLHTLHDTYKERMDQEIQLKSISFKKGDIVSFERENTSFVGVIIKINPKSIGLITLEGVSLMANPMYLSHVKKPSKKALSLKNDLFPAFGK